MNSVQLSECYEYYYYYYYLVVIRPAASAHGGVLRVQWQTSKGRFKCIRSDRIPPEHKQSKLYTILECTLYSIIIYNITYIDGFYSYKLGRFYNNNLDIYKAGH